MECGSEREYSVEREKIVQSSSIKNEELDKKDMKIVKDLVYWECEGYWKTFLLFLFTRGIILNQSKSLSFSFISLLFSIVVLLLAVFITRSFFGCIRATKCIDVDMILSQVLAYWVPPQRTLPTKLDDIH